MLKPTSLHVVGTLLVVVSLSIFGYVSYSNLTLDDPMFIIPTAGTPAIEADDLAEVNRQLTDLWREIYVLRMSLDQVPHATETEQLQTWIIQMVVGALLSILGISVNVVGIVLARPRAP